MKLNKKGLTLVELIVVLVVIILVFLLAVTKINDLTDRAEMKSVEADALAYIKAVNSVVDLNNGTPGKTKYEGLYTIEDLAEYGVKVTGTKPNTGYILTIDSKVKYGCLTYKHRKATIMDNAVTSVSKGTCNLKDGYNANPGVFVADYSGSEQTYVVPTRGLYLLEAWGASGGKANENYGGYGAYVRGYVELDKNDALFINVGGAGTSDCVNSTCPGGYNGGGSATGTSSILVGSGGGATTINLVDGLLNGLAGEEDYMLLVAGGGGGAEYQATATGNGGSGGGSRGGDGTLDNTTTAGGTGGTYTSGGTAGMSSRGQNGSFGKGGNGTQYAAGGGGGYYGGGASNQAGAGGGSGYIGNSRLKDKIMYCYDCQESYGIDDKTLKTTSVSATPQAYTAKLGHGYVRITFIKSLDQIDASSTKVFAYKNGYYTYEVPQNGLYKVELYGAQGADYNASNVGGKGAYTSGTITLTKGTKLYVYVGGKPSGKSAGYNGGATGGTSTDGTYTGGGGATDIRLVSGEWNNSKSLASRIMVAGGGAGTGYYYNGVTAGGAAGALSGISGGAAGNGAVHTVATGGTQTAAGLSVNGNSSNSGFGFASQPNTYGTGGGGGYYGGGSGSATSSRVSAGAGGSSYISGYTGCVAIKSESLIEAKDGCLDGTTDINCSIHYSERYFTNTIMKAGNEEMPTHNGSSTTVGNAGSGFAKITFLGE